MTKKSGDKVNSYSQHKIQLKIMELSDQEGQDAHLFAHGDKRRLRGGWDGDHREGNFEQRQY
jgi:hypothetical protein